MELEIFLKLKQQMELKLRKCNQNYNVLQCYNIMDYKEHVIQ